MVDVAEVKASIHDVKLQCDPMACIPLWCRHFYQPLLSWHHTTKGKASSAATMVVMELVVTVLMTQRRRHGARFMMRFYDERCWSRMLLDPTPSAGLKPACMCDAIVACMCDIIVACMCDIIVACIFDLIVADVIVPYILVPLL
jgi:hypothetical protein